MATGTVKWFNDAKGYGFIERPGQEDVFLHFSALKDRDGWITFYEGDELEFEVVNDPKGLRAAKVVVIRSANPDIRQTPSGRAQATATEAQHVLGTIASIDYGSGNGSINVPNYGQINFGNDDLGDFDPYDIGRGDDVYVDVLRVNGDLRVTNFSLQ